MVRAAAARGKWAQRLVVLPSPLDDARSFARARDAIVGAFTAGGYDVRPGARASEMIVSWRSADDAALRPPAPRADEADVYGHEEKEGRARTPAPGPGATATTPRKTPGSTGRRRRAVRIVAAAPPGF